MFTLAAGGKVDGTAARVRALTVAVAEHVDLSGHTGVHPRLGALDVVPFVALAGSTREEAVDAARAFATWAAGELELPVFLYDAADPTAGRCPTCAATPSPGADPTPDRRARTRRSARWPSVRATRWWR